MQKIASAKPAESAIGIPRTQEETHHRRDSPEKSQHIAGPRNGERRMRVIVEIDKGKLGDESQGNGEKNEPPNPLPKGARSSGSSPTSENGQQSCRSPEPVSPHGSGVGTGAEKQKDRVSQD